MHLSVVIPTRNRGDQIIPTVESVLSDLNCTNEVIVIDQSTSDATAAALDRRGWRTDSRLVYSPVHSVGAARARNTAIGLARADVVAFIDDDCTAVPGWAEQISGLFAREPEIAVFFGPVVAAPECKEGWI